MKVLAEEGDWAVVIEAEFPNRRAKVRHIHDVRPHEAGHVYMVHSNSCVRCGKTIPQSMLALRNLYNMGKYNPKLQVSLAGIGHTTVFGVSKSQYKKIK